MKKLQPSRRAFLKSCSALAAAGLTGSFVLAGCDNGIAFEPMDPGIEGMSFANGTLTVDTTLFQELSNPGGFLWVRDVGTIIINDPQVGLRAFDAICPHEGEPVRLYNGTGTQMPNSRLDLQPRWKSHRESQKEDCAVYPRANRSHAHHSCNPVGQ